MSEADRPVIPLHEFLGLDFRPADPATPGRAQVVMPVATNAIGANGTLHGGAVATLIDVTSALAAARLSEFDMETQSLVTTDIHVRYIGHPRSDHLTATANVVRMGRQSIVVTCEVADAEGHLTAVGDLGMMVVTRRRALPGVESA
jgi:acyl-CoA thioesterase